ncbi:Uncharacterised protein [uncultured Comamonas sp.]|nr:Uncharacterised protein [uncultured Comamonas sp.]
MSTIISWLEYLKILMPPKHISLVGAGNGKGTWAQWLAHQTESRVTFIEAEPLQYSILQRTLNLLGERAQHCEIRNTVVAAQQGTASFFVANSQQESGLLEPRLLLSLWPNLQTQEVRELSAITLDTLLSDLSEDVDQPVDEGHWLVIDCLPAGVLLRASSKLNLVDVVIARVLLGEMHAMPDGTNLEEVAEFLQQKGMVQIAVEANRHPGIGYALFVRDARTALHVHRSECRRLGLNGEEQAKLLQELQAQVRQLTQTKAAAEKRLQELAQQLEQMSQALEEQSRLAQERLSQTEQLTQAKVAVDKQAKEHLLQIEKLKKIQADEIRKFELKSQMESNVQLMLEQKKNAELLKNQEQQNKEKKTLLYRLEKHAKELENNRLIRGLILTERSKARWPFFLKIEELQVSLFLQFISLIKPSVVIDVGANVGFYTLIAQKYFPNLHCIAFEPTPETYINLVQNLQKNKNAGDVDARNLALSSKIGQTEFSDFGDCSGKNGVLDTSFHEQDSIKEKITVKTDTLDNLFTFSKKNIVMKIDVEGHELDVIKGGVKLIKENNLILQIETGHKCDVSILQKFLAEQNYDLLYKIGPDSYYSNIPEFKKTGKDFLMIKKACDFMVNHQWDVEVGLS